MPLLLTDNISFEFDNLPDQELSGYAKEAVGIISEWQSGKERFILSTSGSTGQPKEIFLKREYITYSAQLTAKTFGLNRGDMLLCCLPLDKIAGFMMVMRAVVNECDLLLLPPSSNPLKELRPKTKIDFAAFVPMQMEAILESGEESIRLLNRMKAIIIGGADVSSSLQQRLQLVSVPVFHTYGMTETYTHVAIRRLNGPFSSSWYTPLEGVNISLDKKGCIVIKSVVTGNQSLITNDFAEFKPSGEFRFIGRADLVINSGGIKIQPEEVEKAAYETLGELGLSAKVAATGVLDQMLGQKLILIIEGETWTANFQSSFLEELKQRLSSHKAPKELIFIDKLPMTSNGKIDRAELRKSMGL